MNSTFGFQSVESEPDIKAAQQRASALVRRTPPGSFTLSKVAGWTALPVESAMHFGTVHMERMLSALAAARCAELWAVALEDLGEYPSVYRVAASEAALREFNGQCGALNFVLLPQDSRFAIVCTTDDFFVAVGPPEFASRLAGASVELAFEQFRLFASGAGWNDRERAFFRSILTALQLDYTAALPGVAVTFPRAVDLAGPRS
jgi:hypothetical protein